MKGLLIVFFFLIVVLLLLRVGDIKNLGSLSSPSITKTQVKKIYQSLSSEEKQAARACVIGEIGYDGLKQLIEDVKQGSVEEDMVKIVLDCLQDVENSQKTVATFSNDYEGELVKPAIRNLQRWEDARCNDGTPFAFKIEKPLSNITNNWIIYFQGGGMCDDNALLCDQRKNDTPTIITTLSGRDGQKYQIIGNQGIFNHDSGINPEFYNTNKVYAHYCSSDAWSGSTATLHQTSADTKGWYFSGRINAQVMFEVLKEQYGLDDANPDTKILLTGGSAGCMGTNVNAEQAVQLFPTTAKTGRLKIVSDGCFIPNYNDSNYPVGDSDDSIREVVIQAYDFWNSAINSKCETEQGKKGMPPGNCFMGSTLYPYLTECGNDGLCLQNLVQYSSIDHWAVTAHHIDPKASATNIALEEWRKVTLDELANSKINWLFSGGEISYHTLLMRDAGWIYGPKGGPTFGEVVNSFWKGEAPRQIIFGNP